MPEPAPGESVPASAGMTRYLGFLCAQSLTAQLQEADHTGRFGRDRGLDRPRRQKNVRGCRAWARGGRCLQSLRRLCADGAVLPGGLPVAWRQTRRCLRVLRRRHQGRGTAPVLFERRQFGERAHPYGHVYRQHRAAPRHGRRTAGQGSGRDCAGGIHHAKQRRLDHVRQKLELTACDSGDHRLAAITLSHGPKMAGEQGLRSANQFVNEPSPERAATTRMRRYHRNCRASPPNQDLRPGKLGQRNVLDDTLSFGKCCPGMRSSTREPWGYYEQNSFNSGALNRA